MWVRLLLFIVLGISGCARTPVASPTPVASTPAPVSPALLRQLSYAESEIRKGAYASAARHAEDLLKQFKLFQGSQELQIRAHKVAGAGYIGSKRKTKAIPHYRALVKLDPANKPEYRTMLRKLGH